MSDAALRCRLFGHRFEYVAGDTDQHVIARCVRSPCGCERELTDREGARRFADE
jgi:hypothetical protein